MMCVVGTFLGEGLFSYPSVLTHVLGAQRNIETVLLITHNICFG